MAIINQVATTGAVNQAAMPAKYDLVIYKGDYVELFAVIKDSNGVPKDLYNYTAAASMKLDFSDLTPIRFECTITGIPGEVRIYLPTSLSSNLIAPKDYVWDFELRNSSGDAKTYLAGKISVVPQVTTV